MASRQIIGLVGQPSSGKDTVADYLVDEYEFKHVSMGDLIRAYIADNHLGEPTRPRLKEVAHQLRQENGADYLAQLALQDKSDCLIISGLRTPAEAGVIKKAGGVILCIEASLEGRYQRALSRGRPGDNLTFEEFKRQQVVEQSAPDATDTNVDAVIALADYTIKNDQTLKELHQKIDTFFKQIQ